MIRDTAQSSLVNNDVKQKKIGKGKNDQSKGKCDQSGGKRDQNRRKLDQSERSVGNDIDQGTTAGNGGQNDRENRNKDNNERENENPNIFDQLSVSGQLLIVIIFCDDEFDYVIFLLLQ